MREEQARSILRILGIATLVVGGVMTSQAFFAWATYPQEVLLPGLGRYVPVEGMAGDVPRLTIVFNALIIVFGAFLCAFSSRLALYVVGGVPSNKPQQATSRETTQPRDQAHSPAARA